MYKITLSIYLNNDKPIEIIERSKELDTMILQTNLQQVLLLKLKQLNAGHDLIFVEELKEKDEEYFDYDRAWIKVNKDYSDMDIFLWLYKIVQ